MSQCFYCGDDIPDVGMLWMGDCHVHCYQRRHPFQPHHTLESVINSMDDPVLVRRLLIEIIPPPIAEILIEQYNIRAYDQWLRRCQDFAQPTETWTPEGMK
jgi:hypothetical protein